MAMEPHGGFNYLRSIQQELIQLPKFFREAICHECGWSESTFYRKMRGRNISNAEKEKILSTFLFLLNKMLERNDALQMGDYLANA